MSEEIDKVYDEAVTSGLLPGFSCYAGDKNGRTLYVKSGGKADLKDHSGSAFLETTMSNIASMTKLMTAIAALQCVEDGTLRLDQEMESLLPGIGKYGILTGFDGENDTNPILEPNTVPITLRMLLTHTSGHEYDWMSPSISKWRASRNELPWAGKTVEEKSTVPLLFTPGTAFAYGHGHDWAGKAIEKVTGATLDEFLRRRVWTPLGIENDASFHPEARADMSNRLASVSTHEKGGPPAVDAVDFDPRFGATDCLGGGPCWMTPHAHLNLLSAVMQRDSRLLKPESYEELFRPQLNEMCENAMNEYIASSPLHSQFLGFGIAPKHRVTWALAGMVIKENVEGRFSDQTVTWGGATSCQWYIDMKAGIFGASIVQILPPMHPPVMQLHGQFQEAIYERFGQK